MYFEEEKGIVEADVNYGQHTKKVDSYNEILQQP